MEFQEAKRTLHLSQNVCKEFEERAVDMDIMLPDYCPDVTAILKCMMRPVITARFQSGDRYTVDGLTTLRILYLTEDREAVYSYEATQPFSVSFRSDGALHHIVDVKNDYVNCRAVSPRRIDIHGAFRVFLSAFGEGTATVFADPVKRGVFCQTRSITSTVPVCESEKSFLIDETIDLGVRADRLLYADAVMSSCDQKILTNKLIVKGTLNIKAVYCADGHIHTALQEIPFSQIVDVDGLTDTWSCETHVSVGENESYMQQNETGSSLLFVNCKLTACVRCSMQETTEVVLDAYSVEHPLVCETMPLHTSVGTDARSVRTALQQTTTLPEGSTSVEDIWGELKSYEIRENEHGKQLTCCILVSLIARDSTGHLGYYERTIDCVTACDSSAEDVALRLLSVNGSVSGDQLRVQAELDMVCKHLQNENLTVVSDVVADVQHSYPRCSAAIRIVYAAPGETLWEIAKSHHSCVEDIVAENDLSEQELTASTMLMIPMM